MELFRFPPLDSWTHESWLWVKLYHISSADSKHILPSEELCPSLPSCYHLIGAVTASSKGHSIFLSAQLLQDDGECGQGVDAPLSETGFRQAAAAGQFLSNVQFTHAFSSDLTRTKQTIHGILEKSRFCKDMAVKYDSRLRERMYGVAEGKPLSELRAMAKAAGEECPMFTPPGGETVEQVKMRGKDFFDFICQLILGKAGQRESVLPGAPGSGLESSLAEVFPVGKHGSLGANPKGGTLGLAASILVVSHGAYMRSLFGYFLSDLRCSLPGARDKLELSSITPNTGISVFIIDCEEARQPSIQCVCMNLQEHLNGVTEKQH